MTLLLASQTRSDLCSRELVERLQASLLENMHRQGWQTGIPLAVETPGMMTGLAGTGYQLLRLAEPAGIPSLLLLEPPIATQDQTHTSA